MNKIEEFIIPQAGVIALLIPPLSEKFNYYYEPTSMLHKFDQITVMIENQHISTIIALDNIQEIVVTLRNGLKLALINRCPLPNDINRGELGRVANIDLYQENHSQNKGQCKNAEYIYQYSLWGYKNIQTWMYNHNNKIYLEISEWYPEEFDDISTSSEREFLVFMNHYKPIFVSEIAYDEAERWLKKCDELITTIDSKYVFNKD